MKFPANFNLRIGQDFFLARVGRRTRQTMRLLIAATVASLACQSLSAQTNGTVNFGNNNFCRVTNELTGNPVTVADGIQAALYWAELGSTNFVPVGPAVNVGAPLPGIFAGGTRMLTNMSVGVAYQFQVRAWETNFGSTYEEAQANQTPQQNRLALLGESSVIQVNTGVPAPPAGSPPPYAPIPPGSLTASGLTGFAVKPNTAPPVVANTNDSGLGSLREAIANAWDGDTVTFAPGVTGPINLSTVGDNTYGPSALLITNTLTIEGNGIIIQRDAGVTNLRLFYVSPTGNLTLRNVTLRDGLAQGGNGGDFYQRGGGGGGAAGLGGAIFNRGTLALEDSTLTGNRVVGGNGGASAGPGGYGGGGGGGGLALSGGAPPDPYGSYSGGPGGDPNGGAAGTTGNGGNGGLGGGGGGASGGGYTGGAGGYGGGGGGGGGYTVGLGGAGGFGAGGGGAASGSADGAVPALGGFGGGSGALGENGGNLGGPGGGGAGLGGAIFNDAGTLAITNSTISGNTAQGGNAGAYDTTGGAGGGFGAGVFNHDGTATILNSTLANNTVAAGTGTTPVAEGGAIYNLQESGTATLTLVNSLLANSLGGSDAVNTGGTVTGDHNLVETSSGLPAGVVTVTNNPDIGPLTDNYGFTFTHALLAGSPAIDAGNDSNSPATDQRGLPRLSGLHVDIGAVELQVIIASNPPILTGMEPPGNGAFQFSFTNTPGASFSVFTTTNLALPFSDWTVLGPPTEIAPGQFQFSAPMTNDVQRYYRVRSP